MSVIIFSGGLDSTVLLTKIKDEVKSILTFDYGQKHRKEIEHAKLITDYLGLKDIHEIVDLLSITGLISKGSLMTNEKIPYALYNDDIQKHTIVPNRNMIMLSIAVGHAITIGSDKVYYAPNLDDYHIYLDCRYAFVQSLNHTIHLAGEQVEIQTPFISGRKSDIVRYGIKINAPLHLTWSCYEGNERPCLSCGSCLERIESFIKNNTKDPILTSEEWDKAVDIYERNVKRDKESL